MRLRANPTSSQAQAAAPAPLVTGLCDRGRHDECSGKVYVGHHDETSTYVKPWNRRMVARYVPCGCDCGHGEVKAALTPPSEDRDPLEGLPPDLVRVLRDPSIRIPMDRNVDLALYVYDNVPSNTASAMTVEDWQKAWMHEWQRANTAEYELEELRAANEARDSQRKTA